MSGLAVAFGVIIVPGAVSLFLVRRHGPLVGVIILVGMVIWFATSFYAARNPGSAPIQPEIFGGQTIGYSQRLGLREGIWTIFVLPPATLWAGIALLIGRAAWRKSQGATS